MRDDLPRGAARLRDDGTLWLNVGDSYNHDTKWGGSSSHKNELQQGYARKQARERESGCKPKDLVGIPWMLAFALRADGWYLRQDIIWQKPNPMPESVTDRCTKSHEYVFLLSKSARYFYDKDAIAEDCAESSIERWEQDIDSQEGSPVPGKTNGMMKAVGGPRKVNGGSSFGKQNHNATGTGAQSRQFERPIYYTRNRRDVWQISTKSFKEAHFATFPPELPELCIKAGSSERGCCPKCGAAWLRQTKSFDSGIPASGNKTKRWGQNHTTERADGEGDVERQSSIPWNFKDSVTTGWQPACGCGGDPLPCVVLDPFGGAGTTGLVADRPGRDAILIELNPDYAALTRQRISKDAGLFADVQ